MLNIFTPCPSKSFPSTCGHFWQPFISHSSQCTNQVSCFVSMSSKTVCVCGTFINVSFRIHHSSRFGLYLVQIFYMVFQCIHFYSHHFSFINSIVFQVSALYNIILLTMILWMRHFLPLVMSLCHRNQFNLLIAFRPRSILCLISSLSFLFSVISTPTYLKALQTVIYSLSSSYCKLVCKLPMHR